jgi:hypothetical protein
MTKIAASQYVQVAEMYRSGMTQVQIGAVYGANHSAVCQILKKLGVKKVKVPRQKYEAAAAERIYKEWGLSLADYKAHVAEHGLPSYRGTPMQKFTTQKRGARLRGIAWQFTFAEWWGLWMDSGKWAERKQGGYVMARFNDGDTPYSPSTVYICTNSQNIKDAAINVPVRTRRHAQLSGAGTGKGYSVDLRCGKNPYFARLCGKAIGNFATPEAARAAYLAAVAAQKESQA